MALNVAVRTFTFLSTDAVGTTSVVSLPAGFDLKVVLFTAVGRSGTGQDAPIRMAQGAASSPTARFCAATDSADAVANADCYSWVKNDAVIAWPNGTSLFGGAIDISAFGATSFTAIVDAQLDGFNCEVVALCLGGSDITNVAVGVAQAPAAAGNWDGPALGFDPTPVAADRTALVLMGGSFVDVTINTAENLGGLSVGVATSSTAQGVMSMARRIGVNRLCRCIYSSSYVFAGNFEGTDIHTSHAFNSWQAGAINSFRLTKGGVGDMTYRQQLGYVVIKGPRFSVHTFALRTATGNFSVTAPGFPVTALLTASTNRATATQAAFVAESELAIGMAADPGVVEQASVWSLDTDLATSDVQERLDKTRTFMNYSRTGADTFAIESDGTFVGDTASGYDLNQTDADATAHLWLALGIGAAPAAAGASKPFYYTTYRRSAA